MRFRIVRFLAVFALLSSVAVGQASFEVIGWNVESGGADPDVIAQRISDAQGIEIWGLSESLASSVRIYTAAADDSENAAFDSILGETGGADRLMIIYNSDRFQEVESFELDEINIGGNVRAPLVARFRDRESGLEFLFMVNHLYRSREDRRHDQSRMLNEWASGQTLPVIMVGDYNYDLEVNNEQDRDDGFHLLTAAGIVEWVRPKALIRTQCSATPAGGCRFNSVLDFVFTANLPASWSATSEILSFPGDFPDDETNSDHRQVIGRFQSGAVDLKARILARIAALEQEIAALRALVDQLP